MLASKAAIACRLDYFGGEPWTSKEIAEIEKKVGEIRSKIKGVIMTAYSERVKIHGRSLWSRNADKGVSLRGERLRREGKKEWRQWNPRTSKLASGEDFRMSSSTFCPVPTGTVDLVTMTL